MFVMLEFTYLPMRGSGGGKQQTFHCDVCKVDCMGPQVC